MFVYLWLSVRPSVGQVVTKLILFILFPIGFFPSDNDDKSEFDKVANSLFEKYKFAFTTNADVAKEHGYEE